MPRTLPLGLTFALAKAFALAFAFAFPLALGAIATAKSGSSTPRLSPFHALYASCLCFSSLGIYFVLAGPLLLLELRRDVEGAFAAQGLFPGCLFPLLPFG